MNYDEDPSAGDQAYDDQRLDDQRCDTGDTDLDAGTFELTVDVNNDDRADVSVGVATEDFNGDGTPDTAIVETADATLLARDANRDGDVDVIVKIDDTGEMTGFVRDADGEWVSGPLEADGSTPTAPTDTEQPSTTAQPTSPAGGAEISVDTDGDNRGDFVAGPAQLDVDGDGTGDAAVVVEPTGETFVAFDGDGDGTADVIVQVDPESGESIGAVAQNDDGTWEAVALDETAPTTTGTAPGANPTGAAPEGEIGNEDPRVGPSTTTTTDSAPVEVPAEFRSDPPPAGDPTYVTWQAGESIKTMSAELWTMAHPGEPWPADETGNAYHPYVVLGVLATDTDVDPQIKQVAQQGQESWDRMTNLAVNGPQG